MKLYTVLAMFITLYGATAFVKAMDADQVESKRRQRKLWGTTFTAVGAIVVAGSMGASFFVAPDDECIEATKCAGFMGACLVLRGLRRFTISPRNSLQPMEAFLQALSIYQLACAHQAAQACIDHEFRAGDHF